MSAQIQITKGKTLKYMAVHGIVAMVLIAILGAVVSSLGTPIPLEAMTIVVVVLGSGLAAAVLAHIKGNLLLIGFIGGSTATGAIMIIASVAGLTSMAASATLLFVGNFVAAMVSRYFHKG